MTSASSDETQLLDQQLGSDLDALVAYLSQEA